MYLPKDPHLSAWQSQKQVTVQLVNLECGDWDFKVETWSTRWLSRVRRVVPPSNCFLTGFCLQCHKQSKPLGGSRDLRGGCIWQPELIVGLLQACGASLPCGAWHQDCREGKGLSSHTQGTYATPGPSPASLPVFLGPLSRLLVLGSAQAREAEQPYNPSANTHMVSPQSRTTPHGFCITPHWGAGCFPLIHLVLNVERSFF